MAPLDDIVVLLAVGVGVGETLLAGSARFREPLFSETLKAPMVAEKLHKVVRG